MNKSATVVLNNGVKMPLLGFGVFKLKEGTEVIDAVKTALRNGYRSIDTAYAYHNEAGVAKGIKESGISREDIFITSKVGNNQQGYKGTINAFHQSLKELKTDYLDLYLIHWPQEDLSIETWKAMEDLYEKGLIRAIGVSNYWIHHLEYFLPRCNIIPAVNQVEFHPHLSHPELLKYCEDRKIQVESWSPLMQGEALAIPEIQAIAIKTKKTPAQVILRWLVQKGVVVIPRSATRERIISNSQLFDFHLDNEDIRILDSLNRNKSMRPYFDKFMFLIRTLIYNKQKKHVWPVLAKATAYKANQKIKTYLGALNL